MYNHQRMHEETVEFIGGAGTIAEYVDRLERRRVALTDWITKEWPVGHVDPPAAGSLLLYAEGGWEGTFGVLLRAALLDAFDEPAGLVALVVWIHNGTASKPDAPYFKVVGYAESDVLAESDGIPVVRFWDGRVVDIEDIVAVSF